ncbi:MAG: exonuclease domain-containing protein, partial [Eubacterium sp.]|nr:exonuclease domain-containing protein [Eubacterium sp.]
MFYVIFDLEWNNAYDYRLKKGTNEIIEIGAIKLDEKLNIVDTYKQLIKPKLSKKLSSRFKNLTHISMEEINESGIFFEEAIADFTRWSGGENSIFLSWSNSDLYVLIDNFKKFLGSSSVDFIKQYADVQKYCQSFTENGGSNQISLAKCAEIFEIEVDTENLHRALEDCYLSAECFKKVFDKEKFLQFVVSCDKAFFERLVFKPYYISKPTTEEYNVYNEVLNCPYCKSNMRVLKQYESINKSFRTVCECTKCNKKFWAFIRAKKTYDGVVVTHKINIMNKKRAEKFNRNK